MQKKEDWSVAFFCLFVLMSVYGIQRTSSVFFVEVSHAFSTTKEAASVPFTTLYLLENILGPIAGYLGTRYDPSTIVLLGCFLESCGVALNFLAQDILTVVAFWGVLQGIGQGLVASLIPPILNNNFDKYFSTACGIAFCGNSIGGIVLPLLSKTLIETYAVSGAFLIIGGLILHTVPIMLTIRYKASRKRMSKYANDQSKVSISERKVNDYLERQSYPSTQNDSVKEVHNVSRQCNNDQKHSITPLSVFKLNFHVKPQLRTSSQIKSDLECDISKQYKNDSEHPITLINARKLNDILEPQPCSSHQNINKIGDKVFTTNGISNVSNDSNLSDNQNESRWYPFRVFLDPTFIAMMLLQGSLFGIFSFVNTMLVDMFLEKNIFVTESIYILTGISTADIIGRVGIGRFSDSGFITIVNLAIICLISMMCSYLSLVWCTGFVACLLSSIVHGLASGSLTIVTISIVKKYSRKEFLTIALASKNILTVPFILVIPPIIGFFKDRNGSYNGIMFILSGICFVCSFVTYYIPYLARRRDAREIRIT